MPCVAAIIKKEGRILMQQRADDGRWGMPGGAIDPGESPAQAIVREVYEEVGLKVRPRQVLAVFGAFPRFRHFYPNGDEVHLLVTVFACDIVGGELRCQQDEVTDVKYFEPAEAARLTARRYPAELFAATRHLPYFEWRDEWLEVARTTS
jgi:mutator protein MutT